MKKSELIKVGGLISPDPVTVKAKWVRPVDGVDQELEFDVGIIRPAFDEMERVLTIQDDKSRTATLISLCVRLEGDKGKFDQALSYDEARRLEWNLVRALVDAIKATNNIGNKEKKSKPRG
jgi:hypothetical protein